MRRVWERRNFAEVALDRRHWGSTLSMLRTIVSLMVAAALAAVGVVPANGKGAFSDISSHWARSTIEAAVARGYVAGYPDGTFKPNANVTRAEFLAVVTRASKLSVAAAQEPFADVPANHWAVDAINRGIGMGFIRPEDFGGGFKPNQALTRAEMVKWLVSGLAKSNADFAQAMEDTKETILPFTEFYRNGFKKADIPYIAVALGTGLVGGFPDGSFGPDKPTTRAEVVTLLTRYLAVEGTNPANYRALNELREVGTKGTNVVSLTNATWTRWMGKEAPIYDVMGDVIPFHNGAATATINKIIVVNFSKGLEMKDRGVYAPMFYFKFPNELEDVYVVFSELTVTPLRDISSTTTFADGIQSITGFMMDHHKAKQFALKAIKLDSGVHEFSTGAYYPELTDYFKKGVSRTLWTYTAHPKERSISVGTTGGRRGGFVMH